MKISKKQKISICILVVALGALVADRTVLRPGDATPAKAGAAEAAAGNLTQAAKSETQAAEGSSLAARLRELASAGDFDSQAGRDAFKPSQKWLAELCPPKPQPEPRPTRGRAKPPEPVHHLTAVILADDGGRAIVDGKCLRVGQELNGMKLISVSTRSAVLEFMGKRVELTLETDPQANGSP